MSYCLMPVLCKEYDILNLIQNILYPVFSYFSVIHVNCQRPQNKFIIFLHFLGFSDVFFDIICITETWLMDNELQFFRLDNYVSTGSQRDTREDGARAFVRCGLDVRECTVCGVAGADVHAVSLGMGGSSYLNTIKITIIYRQPSTDVKFFFTTLKQFYHQVAQWTHLSSGKKMCSRNIEQTFHINYTKNTESTHRKPFTPYMQYFSRLDICSTSPVFLSGV